MVCDGESCMLTFALQVKSKRGEIGDYVEKIKTKKHAAMNTYTLTFFDVWCLLHLMLFIEHI